MPKIIITGSRGRMGQMLIACAEVIPELEVVGQVDVGDDLHSCIDKADVVIDFSLHHATLSVARLCAEKGKALVSEVTFTAAAPFGSEAEAAAQKRKSRATNRRSAARGEEPANERAAPGGQPESTPNS